MNAAKTLLNFILAGALLGIVVASWLVPNYLGWNNETPYATQTMCNLPEVIRQTSADLISYQGIGGGVGAAVFLVLGVLFLRWTHQRARGQARQTPPPTEPRATP
ncbi:hypothetical protein [Corallococcus macrosporus]|uniref:Uncharacterized protein n=2 Tax=Myxococcaceae TaxID=31 RepID=A0A250JM25_9BACT|nr:hypothetical protein [Corallococcus macrosporus]AEI63183.1 hypothetical protein LILAB_06320 [Corallococcus macrosporus]ATB44934.1 hypothetical protein MYMAC_000517 [Corallococcus macrosporus DSM 14697]